MEVKIRYTDKRMDYQISFTLDKALYYQLAKKATQYNLSLSDYMRKISITSIMT